MALEIPQHLGFIQQRRHVCPGGLRLLRRVDFPGLEGELPGDGKEPAFRLRGLRQREGRAQQHHRPQRQLAGKQPHQPLAPGTQLLHAAGTLRHKAAAPDIPVVGIDEGIGRSDVAHQGLVTEPSNGVHQQLLAPDFLHRIGHVGLGQHQMPGFLRRHFQTVALEYGIDGILAVSVQPVADLPQDAVEHRVVPGLLGGMPLIPLLGGRGHHALQRDSQLAEVHRLVQVVGRAVLQRRLGVGKILVTGQQGEFGFNFLLMDKLQHLKSITDGHTDIAQN